MLLQGLFAMAEATSFRFRGFNSRRGAITHEHRTVSFAGEFEIINAEAVGLGAAVGAAVGGVDHHGITVLLLAAQVEGHMGDVYGSAVGWSIGAAPEQQIAGFQILENRMFEGSDTSGHLDQAIVAFEPQILVCGGAGWFESGLAHHIIHCSGAVKTPVLRVSASEFVWQPWRFRRSR